METTTQQAALAGGLLGFLGGMAATIAVVTFVLWIIQIIAYWRIFQKAGEPGWKAIIPVYNAYVQFKLTWNTKMFWITMILAVLMGLLSNYVYSNKFIMVLYVVVVIATIVISIMSSHKLSLAYGHGVGFTLGLIFLSPIFILILGLGKSQYIGNTTVNNVAMPQ